jgi:hypothetical protein
MPIKLQSKSFTFLLIFFGIHSTYAAEAPSIVVEKNETFEEQFIQKNIEISNWLDRVAEKIDLFLVGKRVTNRKNETYVRIQNSTFSQEGEPFINTFSVNFNPRFPNLEDFLQLKFTSTNDRDETRKAVSSNLNQNQTEKKYGAAVGLFKKLGTWKTSFQPRVSLQNPIKLSHSLNFENVSQVKSTKVNPKLEFFADADKGIGFYNAINFSFALTKIYSLTFINDGEYLEKLHMYTVNNGFELAQLYSDKIYLGYSLILTSNNRPSYHLENYVVAFSWSHQIYKKILDYQLIPQVDFQKEKRFKGSAGLRLNVNLNF